MYILLYSIVVQFHIITNKHKFILYDVCQLIFICYANIILIYSKKASVFGFAFSMQEL